ncbi:MAG: ABC transporter permease [Nitratireductor sp.]
MDIDIIIQVLGATLRVATPLLLACLAGLYAERSGVVDIGLEGKMLIAAFAAAAAASIYSSAWMGLFIGILASVSFAIIHGFSAIVLRGNQMIVGVALNMLAIGIAFLLGDTLFNTAGSSPGLSAHERFGGVQLPFHNDLGSFYASVISGQSLLVYVALACVPLTYFVMYYTRFGLRLRAVGEAPHAVDTAGISVAKLRFSALIIGGILCGIGGTFLSIAQSAGYNDGMTANRGFIALAALIFAKWRPVQALGACLLFGFVEAAGYQIQGNIEFESAVLKTIVEFVESSIPYLLTVFILAGFVGKATPPAAAGVPYVKGR